MAYRLKHGESVVHGLRRLAAKELRDARQQLRGRARPREEAIHGARTSVKKVRAIVQLIDADRGKLRGAKKRIHAVGKALSELRDADAMMTTLTNLKKTQRGLISEKGFARLQRRVLAHKRDAMKAAARAGVWEDVARELGRLRRLARRWRPRHTGFEALAPGISATHRLGRKALTRARNSQRAEDFHEWRKQVKALWYELRLLEDSGSAVRRDISALHKAEAWLGEDHNVVVLCEELSKKASPCHGLVDLDRLRRAADRVQCTLRKRAIARVQGIYRRGSGSYLRKLERDWKSSRRRARSVADRSSHASSTRSPRARNAFD